MIPTREDALGILEGSKYALRMLLLLHDQGAPVSSTWLMRRIPTSPATVLRCARHLVEAGVVSEGANDSQARVYSLTSRGAQLLATRPREWRLRFRSETQDRTVDYDGEARSMRSLTALFVAGAMSILLIVASFSMLSSWGASSPIGTTPATGGTGTTPTGNEETLPRGNCPGGPLMSNGTGSDPLPYRYTFVVYDTRTGSIGGEGGGVPNWQCGTTYSPEDNPSFSSPCNLVKNGSSPGPGLGCLDVSRDPNLDAFLSDAWSGHMDDWIIDLQALTLQRR